MIDFFKKEWRKLALFDQFANKFAFFFKSFSNAVCYTKTNFGLKKFGWTYYLILVFGFAGAQALGIRSALPRI